MERKACILLSLICCGLIHAADAITLPDDAGMIQPPADWKRIPAPGLILRGPGKDAGEAPRLVVTIAAGDAAATAASLREGWQRLVDGYELIDDEDQPIGGRVWRRIQVHFAAGPLAFAQTAWIGTVGGRTVVAVLSAPDDRIARYLPEATAAVASISAKR